MIAENKVDRPSRWDAPFDPKMTEETVASVLKLLPFSAIDQSRFPKHIPLAEILANDTKLCRFQLGDVVVREGDYGNSAFFIMKGKVRVVVPGGAEKLPDEVMGHSESKKKRWTEAISQLWNNSKIPGYRARVRYQQLSEENSGGEAALRGTGGEARVFLQDIPAIISKHNTVELVPGEFFGEIAALGRTPRTATVVASEDNVELLEIKWQGLRDIRLHAPAIKEHVDRLYRERSLLSHLRETALLAHLDEQILSMVAEQTQFKSFGNFDGHGSYKKLTTRSASDRLDDEPVIVGEGDYPDGLILVRSGFARLSERSGNGHRTISYFGRGQHFGFREIVHNWQNKANTPYQYTMRAVGSVDVLVIPTKVVEELVLPTLPKAQMPWHPIVDRKNEGARLSSQELQERDKNKRVGTDVLEFMVENRFINGTATMLIDLDRCTRCDDCVRACATTHNNNPRFIREGKQIGHWLVANACMHCQDPVCMIGCPTGAIHRNADTGKVLINDLACIGCSVCAESCPYENIQMEVARNEKNEFIVAQESQRPILKATKCDFCAEQPGGPSCQQACPHDALLRVDMRDYVKLAKWMNR